MMGLHSCSNKNCMGGVDCLAAVDPSVFLTLPACLFVCALLFHCSPAWFVCWSALQTPETHVLFVNPSVSVNQLVVKTVKRIQMQSVLGCVAAHSNRVSLLWTF